jgi:AAA15 family ATPase/GTPase
MSVVLNFNNGIILSIPSFDIRNFQNLTTRHNPNYLLLLLYIRLASYVATKNLISNRSAKIGVKKKSGIKP